MANATSIMRYSETAIRPSLMAATALCLCSAPAEAFLFPQASSLAPHIVPPVLVLPQRPTGALTGTEFARKVSNLAIADREEEVLREITSGNIPSFLRTLLPVQVTNVASGLTNTATLFVCPDYLAVGSDDDYLLMPMRPGTAQMIADALDCVLPTPKIVNTIWQAATVKLSPSPIPPSAAMTSVAVFTNHNLEVRNQLKELWPNAVLNRTGALIAGHKKDVVISRKLDSAPGKVAIYGWHRTNGAPIQPLFLGHGTNWVDYSQCVRLVHRVLIVNGRRTPLEEVLRSHGLARLLSDEGPILTPRYPR